MKKIKIDLDLDYHKFVHTPFGIYIKRTDFYLVKKLPDDCEIVEDDNVVSITMDLDYFRKNNIKRFLTDGNSEKNKGKGLQKGLENIS